MNREYTIKKTKKLLEKDIQKQVIDWLRINKWFVVKNNTTGIYVRSRDTYITNPSRGLADIVAIKEGKVIMIEVKREHGIQSADQKEFQKKWEEHGGKYLLIHSLEELKL